MHKQKLQHASVELLTSSLFTEEELYVLKHVEETLSISNRSHEDEGWLKTINRKPAKKLFCWFFCESFQKLVPMRMIVAEVLYENGEQSMNTFNMTLMISKSNP